MTFFVINFKKHLMIKNSEKKNHWVFKDHWKQFSCNQYLKWSSKGIIRFSVSFTNYNTIEEY